MQNFKNLKFFAVFTSLIISVGFATYPLAFTKTAIGYALVGGFFIASIGYESMITISVLLGLPILIQWATGGFLTFFILKSRRSGMVRHKSLDNRNRQQEQKKMLREQKAFFTIGLMVGAFTLTILPVVILLLVFLTTNASYGYDADGFDAKRFSRSLGAEFVVTMIFYTNGVWNFLIYSLHYKDFRLAAKKLYRSLLSKFGIQKNVYVSERLTQTTQTAFTTVTK